MQSFRSARPIRPSSRSLPWPPWLAHHHRHHIAKKIDLGASFGSRDASLIKQLQKPVRVRTQQAGEFGSAGYAFFGLSGCQLNLYSAFSVAPAVTSFAEAGCKVSTGNPLRACELSVLIDNDFQLARRV